MSLCCLSSRNPQILPCKTGLIITIFQTRNFRLRGVKQCTWRSHSMSVAKPRAYGKAAFKALGSSFFLKFWNMLFNLLLKVTLSIFCFYFLLKYSWIQSPKLLSYLLYHFISGFKVYLMSTYCVPGNGSRLWRQSKEQFPGDIRIERWKRVRPETT